MLLTNSVNNIASNLINEATGLYSMVQTSATYVAGVLTNLGTFNILSGSVLTNGNAVLSGGATVLVSDTGSVWSNNQLALNGNLNSVVATNGGQLFGKGAITFDTAGYGNTITMGGGLWISSATALTIGGGVNSSNNAFNIVGGTVTNVGGNGLAVGAALGANFNSLIVTGGGGFFMNGAVIEIGVTTAYGAPRAATTTPSSSPIAC